MTRATLRRSSNLPHTSMTMGIKLKPLFRMDRRRRTFNVWMLATWILLGVFLCASYEAGRRWMAMRRYMQMGYTRAVFNILEGGSPDQGKPVQPNGPDNPNQYHPGD